MSAAENHLIELLPRADRVRLLALCEPVELTLSQVLCEPGEALRHVYFPVNGFISQIAVIDGTASLEVGLVGREGMLGAQLALGVAVSPTRALVQGAGAVWRVSVAAFARELAQSRPLQKAIDRYLLVCFSQLANSAGCLRFHVIGPRLARWLLMTQDRAHADTFHITHEFLSYMLGVRRVGITGAAGVLKRSGLIRYHRGELTVLDRPGLEAAACSCYASDCSAYAALLA